MTTRTDYAVTVAGYETVKFFEGRAAATNYAIWAYKLGYSPMTEEIDR